MAVLLEVLRSGGYSFVPVVESGRFVGVVCEQTVFSALFAATEDERRTLRERPVVDFLTQPAMEVRATAALADAARLLLSLPNVDALPVVEDQTRRFVGVLGRADLVQDMHRFVRPPTMGGMATPVGVLLTGGGARGGVGPGALVLTGLLMFSLQMAAFVIGSLILPRGADWVAGSGDFVPAATEWARGIVPKTVWATLIDLVVSLTQTVLFLLLLRLTPVVAYHAAEHQVVHAVEQGEPLLVETVRRMPRVHPRCGTNIATGALIFSMGFFLERLLGAGAFAFSAIAALLYWRRLGGWVQAHLTTKPAGDHHLQQAIAAAHSVLSAQRAMSLVPAPNPLRRLWQSGIAQILCGFGIGYTLLFLLTLLVSPLGEWFAPLLRDILP